MIGCIMPHGPVLWSDNECCHQWRSPSPPHKTKNHHFFFKTKPIRLSLALALLLLASAWELKNYRLKTMLSLKPCKTHHRLSSLSSPFNLQNIIKQTQTKIRPTKLAPRRSLSLSIRGCSGQEEKGRENKSSQRRTFLTLEEAGLVEISGLGTHERFLCRLTVLLV